MKRQGMSGHMDSLLALLLFGVFAVCVLSVLLTGARAYQGVTRRDREAFDRRSCQQYITTRVRQSDVLGGVAVEPFGEVEALVFYDGEFATWVYCYDGWLMELYTFADVELEPRDGEKIMELDSLDMSLEDGLFTAWVDGEPLRLSLRCAEGGLT